jgi:hypothetical protein
MLPLRACEFQRPFSRRITVTDLLALDVFIGLNVVRALSIISLILVFSSSIMTLVDDVEAFSSYQNDPSRLNPPSSDNSTTVSHDYIPYVPLDA